MSAMTMATASAATATATVPERSEILKVYRPLASLLSNFPVVGQVDDLPECLGELVAKVESTPLNDRLTVLETELAKCPGVDVNAVLSEIFAIDPRCPDRHSPVPVLFPVPSTIVDVKREIERPGYETLSLAKVLAMKRVEIDWKVEGLIPRLGVAILGGPPGLGKSWMLLDLALAVAAGRPWLGRFPTKPGRVLYIDEESPPGLVPFRVRKLTNACSHPIAPEEVQFVFGSGLCFVQSDSLDRLRNTISATKPSLVIIDSLIRVHGSDENSASEMARFFAVIKGLIREFGITVVFADHQKKPGVGKMSQDLMLRGSTEKVAFIDTLISLTRKDETLLVEHSKSRFAQPVDSFVIGIIDDGADQTTVRVLGDAEQLRQQTLVDSAQDFVAQALADGAWKSRKVLAESAKAAGVQVKAVDALLKALHRRKKIERDDRPPESGKGHKAAYYRLTPVDGSISRFTSTIESGNGNGNESGSGAPDGALSPMGTGGGA